MNPFHLVFDVLAQLNEDLGLLTKREVDLGEVARRGKLIQTMHLPSTYFMNGAHKASTSSNKLALSTICPIRAKMWKKTINKLTKELKTKKNKK